MEKFSLIEAWRGMGSRIIRKNKRLVIDDKNLDVIIWIYRVYVPAK